MLGLRTAVETKANCASHRRSDVGVWLKGEKWTASEAEGMGSMVKIEGLQSKLGKGLAALLTFEETAEGLVITPKQFLGSARFAEIAEALKPFNATYVSAGKLSHWRIPVVAHQPQQPIRPGSVFKVQIESLVEGKFKVRKWQDPEELSKLRESIRRLGDVISPIPVRQKGIDQYEVLGGHRRLQAAREAGLKEVSVRLFTPESEAEAWAIAWSEDALKEAWSPIAKATAFKRMREEKILVADISLHTGESISVIDHLCDLLKLPPPAQEIIDCGKLGVGHGVQLLRLKDRPEDLIALAVAASEEGWTYQKLKLEVDGLVAPPEKPQIEEVSPKEARKEPATLLVETKPLLAKEAQIGEIRLVECENCGIRTLTPREWEGHTLCPHCAEKVMAQPSAFEEKLKQRSKAPMPAPRVEARVIQPSWEEREARMHVPVSRMEEMVLTELASLGLYAESQKKVCLRYVIPDLWLQTRGQSISIFLDGTEVHKEAQIDRDEMAREELAKRGVKVLSYPYDHPTKEKAREIAEEIARQCQEAS